MKVECNIRNDVKNIVTYQELRHCGHGLYEPVNEPETYLLKTDGIFVYFTKNNPQPVSALCRYFDPNDKFYYHSECADIKMNINLGV